MDDYAVQTRPEYLEVLRNGFNPDEAPRTHRAFAIATCHRTLPTNRGEYASHLASLCILWLRDAGELESKISPCERVYRVVTEILLDSAIRASLIGWDGVVPIAENCRRVVYTQLAMLAENTDESPPPNNLAEKNRDLTEKVRDLFYPAIVEDGLFTEQQLGFVSVKAAGKE